jgi:hypothetical protein
VNKIGVILRVFKATGLFYFKQDNAKDLTYQVMILNDMKVFCVTAYWLNVFINNQG